MTLTAMSRARRYAAGMTIKDIAAADGVTIGSIRQSITPLVAKASRRASPGSELPVGLHWTEDQSGHAYAYSDRGDGHPLEHFRWAVRVLESDKDVVCGECGRAL